MSINIGQTFSESANRMLSATGLVSVVALLVYALGSGVVWAELVAQALRYGLQEAGYSYETAQRVALEEGGPAAAQQLEQFAEPPLGVGLAGAVALLLLLPFISELLYVVAIRAFAATEGRGAGFPTDAITGGLGIAFLRTVVADIVVWLSVAIGMVLIIPGLVLMVVFLFVRQAIVLDGHGVLGSFSTSYGLVRENVAAAVVVWFVGLLLTFGLLFVGGFIPIPYLPTIGFAVVSMYVVSLTTVAYQQGIGPGSTA